MDSIDFLPAQNKLEAVARISNLTNSGPEILGPGSKEHKSVLTNLAAGLGLNFDMKKSKQELGRHILESFGQPWRKDFESAGQTITLKGLNALLLGATLAFQAKGTLKDVYGDESVEMEIRAMSPIIVENTPLSMDGKSCVLEMREAEDRNWRQTEWQGFYFEMKIESMLTSLIGGGRKKFFNTEFDYVRNFIWDIKVHSTANRAGRASTSLILNDTRAIDMAVEEIGLGFVILSVAPTYDLEFTRWHKEIRGGGLSAPGRILKSSFVSQRLDIFHIPSISKLDLAKKDALLNVMKQGRNSNGKPRPTKYSLNIEKAMGSDLQVFAHEFT